MGIWVVFFNVQNLVGFFTFCKQDFFLCFFIFFVLIQNLIKIKKSFNVHPTFSSFWESSYYFCSSYFCFLFTFYLPAFSDLFNLGFYFWLFHLFLIVCYAIKEKVQFLLLIKIEVNKFYNHPKFLSIMQFWKEEYKKRKVLKSGYNKVFKFLETLILGFISWYTALNTRFLLALFFLFFRSFLFSWLLFIVFAYFVGFAFLSFLAHNSSFQAYIKKRYNLNILESLGWENSTFFLKHSILSLLYAKIAVLLIICGNEYFSVLINIYDFGVDLKRYYSNYQFWLDCQEIVGEDANPVSLPKKPSFSNYENKRFSDFYKAGADFLERISK